MRHILIAFALALTVVVAGCGSPVEAACKKADECSLSDETVDECITKLNKRFDELRDKKKDACDKIADAQEKELECMADLSCDEIKGNKGCEKVKAETAAVRGLNQEACSK